ncbi:MAG: hypothetical protein KC547_18240 [Anaerolineae bacterium]|nr:hypothetical protein [Anaerolineae bacterium]
MNRDEHEEFEPQEVAFVRNIETLQIWNNPLHMRVLSAFGPAARSAQDIATLLSLPVDRVQRYIHWLKFHNLIVSIPGDENEEPKFRVRAYRFRIAPWLLAPTNPQRPHLISVICRLLFDDIEADLRRSLRAGIIDLEQEPPAVNAFFWSRQLLEMTPERACWLQERLYDLVLEASRLSLTDEGEKTNYTMTALAFPSQIQEGEYDPTAAAF